MFVKARRSSFKGLLSTQCPNQKKKTKIHKTSKKQIEPIIKTRKVAKWVKEETNADFKEYRAWHPLSKTIILKIS